MSNFALDVTSPPGDVISSLNYVLANLGTFDANLVANIANVAISSANVVTANTITGQIQSNVSGVISYLYSYVNVKYADTATGGSFSSNSTNKLYYGTHNTVAGTISSNPADYNWLLVSGGGFGTTKGLYHTTAGGGQVYFSATTTAPSILYQETIDDQAILLQSLANSIVQTYNITPDAVTNVSIAGNTITTDNIGYGVITANLLAANLIIAKDIVSTNATLGSSSSDGYWLQANTGSARLGGTVSIGNNLGVGNNAVIGNSLIVGTNAQIGGNLLVSGLITSGNLNANTVSTTTIVQNSVTLANAYTNSTGAGLNNPTVGYNSYVAPYYLYQSGAGVSPSDLILPIDTVNANVLTAGQIDVFGYVTANVSFVTQMYAQLYRYGPGANVNAVPGTFTTTPASVLYPGGSVVYATQTILPYRLITASALDTFTTNGAPQTETYRWIIGTLTGTVSFPANVTVPNISFSTSSITATNLKR